MYVKDLKGILLQRSREMCGWGRVSEWLRKPKTSTIGSGSGPLYQARDLGKKSELAAQR